MHCDIDTVDTYLSFLAPQEREIFAFAFLDKESKHQIPGMGIVFNNRAQILNYLQSDKHMGLDYTLHVCLNTTSTAGRKAKDVKAVRVLCLDIDTPTERETIKQLVKDYAPHLIVESSEKKYHVYWKLDPIIPLDDWITYSLGIAHRFGGDFNCAQLQHTIRVPGVERLCKDGTTYTPQIVYLTSANDRVPLSQVDIGRLFPDIQGHYEQAKLLQQSRRADLRKAIKADPTSQSFVDGIRKAGNASGRNAVLYSSVLRYTSTVEFTLDGTPLPERTFEEVLEFAKELSDTFEEKPHDPFSIEEITKTTESAYMTGCDIHQKRVEEILEFQSIPGSVEAGSLLVPEDDSENAESADSVEVPLVTEGAPESQRTLKGKVRGASGVKKENNETENSDSSGKGSTTPHYSVELSAYTPYAYNYDEPILATHRFSDMGVSTRVVQRFHDRMVMVGEQLYAFDLKNRVWRPQSSRSHPQLVSFLQTACLDVIYDPQFIAELCMADGKVSKSKFRKAKDRFTAGRLHQMVVQDVFNSPDVTELPKEYFDAKEEVLYLENGVFNMLTNELRPATAQDYLLNRAAVSLDRHAECPEWEVFVSEVFAGSNNPEEMVSFIQELFGYSLSGSTKEQKLFCHQGDGSNGKSYLLSALAKLLGNYATYLEPSELVRAKNGFDTKFERFGAKIEGKRVAIVDDVDVKAVWNEGTVKNLTSDSLRARAEYERSRSIMNRTKLHLGLNIAPVPEAENHGIIRRLCFIPYSVQFPASGSKGRELDLMIKNELSGIFNWAVEGYKRYFERGGLSYPSDSVIAIAEYRAENFNTESTVADMFEAPAPGEESWHFLTDLVDDIHANAGNMEQTGKRSMDAKELATALKRMFGCHAIKRWHPTKKNSARAVNIKLKYERKIDGSRFTQEL